MENKIRIVLPDKIVSQLIKLPEQGMGYQLVDISLKGGNELKKKLVFNSSILEINENEKLNPKDIDSIKIHVP